MKRTITILFLTISTLCAGISSNYPAIAPSLLLDFANTKALDPRITFNRASAGRYYDGKTYAKAEENLLRYSQDFSSATWGKSGGGVTISADSQPAPDGTATADAITLPDQGWIAQDIASSSNQTYTFSVYLKAASSITIKIGISSPAQMVDANVTTAWQRFVYTVTVGTVSNVYPQILNASGSQVVVHAWGAQLEQRSAATAYTATTTQQITRYQPVLMTAPTSVARFDHNPVTGESLGLLIEEQRSNLLTYSQDFGNAAWPKYVLSIGPSAIGPSGVAIAKLTPSAASAEHYLNYQLSVSANTAYTLSCYAKVGELSRIALRTVFTNGSMDSVSRFALTDGTFAKHENHSSASIVAVGNGWYRISITLTTPASIPSDFLVRLQPLADDGNVTFTGNGYSGIFAGDPQLEAGAFVTSYIPTTSAQATRSADSASMTGTNFSSWYRQDEGTLQVVFKNQASTNYPPAFVVSDGTAMSAIAVDTQTTLRMLIIYGGAVEMSGTGSLPTAMTSVALAYRANDSGYTVNGAVATTDTVCRIPAVNKLGIGQTHDGNNLLNGHIRRLAYYPARLTNAQLQALTLNK